MQTGRIVKIVSNQYTLESNGEYYTASARGKMRLNRKPLVGDRVLFELVDGHPRIHSVQKRENELRRPPVSNVDQALVITSLKDPDLSESLLNRLIFTIVLAGIQPVLCFTKWDLVPDQDKQRLAKLMDQYRKDGYEVHVSFPGGDDEVLKEAFAGKISVLCGQSGAGKSSLLNRLVPDLDLETQEISKALGRGKHTTRVSQLYPVLSGFIADTPGFSSLDLETLDLSHLDEKLPDFQPYLGQCKYDDCRHIHEPGCAIKEAVSQGKILPSIYGEYKSLVENFRPEEFRWKQKNKQF